MTSITIVLVPIAETKDVFRPSDMEDALNYVDEFNRRETESPTGFAALIRIDPACTKNAPSLEE